MVLLILLLLADLPAGCTDEMAVAMGSAASGTCLMPQIGSRARAANGLSPGTVLRAPW
jgi:hypothetical protein